MPSFLVREGPLEGDRLDVESQVVLGRGDADVVIDDPQISRRHALVRAAGELLEIVDLDSLNGTWVNGQRIDAAMLVRPGDVVRLGSTLLELEASLAPEVENREQEPVVPDVPSPPRTPPAGRCPECSVEVPSSARFCLYCGVPLVSVAAARPAAPVEPASVPAQNAGSVEDELEDELRPVTALFADVVGSTSLGERLAPDEVKALIGECVSRMSRAVEQFGGSIQAYMGDGIAGFFGLPTAHEDDPDRAAHAALRILEVVGEYARDISAAWGVDDFNVRVGINGGQTAVGLVGAAERQLVALGDATNVAARLQSAAAPGTIAVGESTARRLAHRFVLESLGEIRVKGREEPVSAWRLVGELGSDRADAPTPLVGRDEEVARLRYTLDELLNGRGQLLLLSGDAGIGKSRLLGELATMASERTLWLEGNARSFGAELVYWSFAEMLRRWLGAEPGDAEVAVRTKLRSKLASLPGLDVDRTVARLGAMLGLRIDAEFALPTQAEEVAREIQMSYCDWIAELAARQPVVVALDDFQWVDAPTRELAASLLELTDRAPILLAVAFRTQPPSEASRFRLHALEHFSHRTTEVGLEPLDQTAAGELLRMLLPDGLDPDAAGEVVARAEGNPLYLEELLRALIEEGGLERRRRTWALTRTPARAVPPALEGLLMARIDHLPEGARRLGQIAAVVGRSFPARVLAHVARGEHFERDVSILLRAQVVKEVQRYPELVYSFKHGLLQECALSTLTPSRREELYGVVAGVFEELYAGARDEHLDVLASYYARSNDRAKALEYLELTGRRAAALNATSEAVSILRRAHTVAVELGDVAAEQRLMDALEQISAAQVGAA